MDSRRSVRRAFVAATCSALVIGGSVTALVGSAAGAVVNPGVTVETWPDLDFVAISGYPVDSTVNVEVFRNGAKIGETTQTAVADERTGAGLVEINHVGNDPAEGVNDCWGSTAFPNTPDIRAGDEIRATATSGTTTLAADSSVVRDITLDTATLGTDSVTFTGHVRSLPNAPVDVAADVLELRVEPAGVRENLAPTEIAADGSYSHVMTVPGVTEASAEEKFLEWSNAGGATEAEATEITVATFPEGPPEAMGCPPYEGAAPPPGGEPGTGQPVLSADPATLPFGDVVVGQQAVDGVTVTNTGTADALMGSAAVTGAGFSLGLDGCSGQPLAVTPEGCEIEVIASPTGSGAISGSLTIPSSNGGTLTVPLSANGVGAVPGDIAVSKTELRFGQQSTNRTKTQSVSVRNEGLGTLAVSGASVEGTGFTLAGNRCTAELAPGRSCNISVQFTATGAPGARSGTLTISSNDPDESTVTVRLSGSVRAR